MTEENKSTAPESELKEAQANGAPAPETAAPEEPKKPTAEELIAAAKKEAADNYDRYVRSVADLDNFRKRTIREKDELRQFAVSRVLEDMFPIIEALSLGIDAAKAPGADAASIVSGMNMVLTQIKTTLGGHGLKELNPAGEKFDPNQHEALSMQPSTEVPEGNVVQVFRPGYALNGRVLRPAAVVVSSGAPKAS